MPSAPSSDQQKHRPLPFLSEARARRDLLVGRPPFLDMGQRKPQLKQQVEVGSQGAVLFEDALGEPIRVARPFAEIAVDGPALAIVGIYHPARMRRRSKDRML